MPLSVCDDKANVELAAICAGADRQICVMVA